MIVESSSFENIDYDQIEKLITQINLKKRKTKKEAKIFEYILSFVNFRLSVLNNNKIQEKLDFSELNKKEEELSKYLAIEDITLINSALLYQDLKLKTARKVPELEEIKNKISRR